MADEHKDTLEIVPHWTGNGTAHVTASINGKVILADQLNLKKASQRETFATRLTNAQHALDYDEVVGTLQSFALDRPDEREPSAAERLVEIATTEAELWHDADRNAYATIRLADHRENYRVRSRAYKLWLRRRLREDHGAVAYDEAIEQALQESEAVAQFEGEERVPHVRVAEAEDGIYLDLGTASWEVVRITPDGWEVVADPPVRFIRPRGLLPLPRPEPGGSVEDLRAFVNVRDDRDFALIVAWLLAALRPVGPYPVLNLTGEQGSAKSTLSRLLRSLVDPSSALLRSAPKEPHDLMIGAVNSWVVAFDNLSGLPAWLSDGLCRLATGGGFATRELYTNGEETIFNAVRPCLLNGISNVAERPDLLDRSLAVNLQPIPEADRRSEAELWSAVEAARPKIVGALLDAVAAGLANHHAVRLDRLPRLADFATWVVACEAALPWPSGTFMEAYAAVREEAERTAIEGDPVAEAIAFTLMATRTTWTGTASELLAALEEATDDRTTRRREWPATAAALAKRLTRVAPLLRSHGIEIGRERTSERERTRTWRITREVASTGREDGRAGQEDGRAGQERSALPSGAVARVGNEKAPSGKASDGSDGLDGRSRPLSESDTLDPPPADPPADSDASPPADPDSESGPAGTPEDRDNGGLAEGEEIPI